MAIPVIPLVAAGLLLGIVIYQYIIYPAFTSPLSKIPPAHFSASVSPLWILNERRRERETFAVHEAHQRLGPIVRLAPNEISVNSVECGIRTVYGGSYEKGDWYYNVFTNYGVMPMFAMPDHEPHSKRKRMLSNIYAKSTLQSSEAMSSITKILLDDVMVPRLREMARKGKPVELYDVFCPMALDFVAAYVFGLKNSTHYFEKPDMAVKFFRDYKARQGYQFWPQDLPRFTGTMFKLGLGGLVVPSWVGRANADIEEMIIDMCDKAEQTVREVEVEGEKGQPEDWPTVYSQLRNALVKDSNKTKSPTDTTPDQTIQSNRLTVASEMLDHTLAGFDTSSIALTFLAHEISLPSNAHWQAKLRTELLALNGNRDAKTLDGLPVLHAILMETLRLHASIPGNQPRITPHAATLGAAGHTVTGLPANVRVQAQAWSLHRNPDVFPEPEVWNPARWLESSEEQMKEMGRWFWAFGSGGRMCVGSNLAMLDMKAIVAGLWGAFKTRLVEGRGMVHSGGYVAGPVGWKGTYCLVELEEL